MTTERPGGASVAFECPLPPTGLRRNSQTGHRGYRASLIRAYQEQVWCAGSLSADEHHWHLRQLGDVLPWGKARVTLTWRHAGVAPDTDNALASCKWLIDVLKASGPRPLGIIVDDAPEHASFVMQTRKVAHKRDECVHVLVERLDTEE